MSGDERARFEAHMQADGAREIEWTDGEPWHKVGGSSWGLHQRWNDWQAATDAAIELDTHGWKVWHRELCEVLDLEFCDRNATMTALRALKGKP